MINLFASEFAPLPQQVENHLYRILQESLTNIRRHANATNVEITLKERGDEIVLIIEDNGVGFAPDEAENYLTGSGLLGMSERAALIGGKLEIDSSPDGGTTILVRWPLKSFGALER